MRPDPDSPQEVGRYVTEVEATLVVHYLAEEGIRACIAGTGSATGWTEDPGNVQVLVRAADVERAMQIVGLARAKFAKPEGSRDPVLGWGRLLWWLLGV